MKKYLVFSAFALFSATSIVYTSCKKDPCKDVSCLNGGTCSGGTCSCPTGYTGSRCETEITKIEVRNYTYTPVTITVAGETKVIPVNGEVIYTGEAGKPMTGSAFTYEATSSGTQVGEKITWNLSSTFPEFGTDDLSIDVPATYFYLKVQNYTSTPVTRVYVNYGLPSQTLDNVTFPADDMLHGYGYYKAFSNSNVRMEGGAEVWEFSNLYLSMSKNQSTIVSAI